MSSNFALTLVLSNGILHKTSLNTAQKAAVISMLVLKDCASTFWIPGGNVGGGWEISLYMDLIAGRANWENVMKENIS